MVSQTHTTQCSLNLNSLLTEVMDPRLLEEAQMVMSTNVSKSFSGFSARNARKPSKVRSKRSTDSHLRDGNKRDCKRADQY